MKFKLALLTLLIPVTLSAQLRDDRAATPTIDRSAHAAIVGQWQIRIIVPGAPGPAFSLSTFSSDGTMIETNTTEGPTLESPGHGVWTQTGPRDYVTTLTNLEYDGNNNFIGRDKVRAKFTMGDDGQSMSGVFKLDVYTADGTNVFSATGTLAATRMNVEPYD
jgi:hypothetical protein